MILRQFLHRDPVGVTSLFTCGGRAAGAAVDPAGEIEPYVRAAETAALHDAVAPRAINSGTKAVAA